MTIDSLPDARTALDRFRALAMADAALTEALSREDNAGRFVELAMRAAEANGLALSADAVQAEIAPDPLGLTRWIAAPVNGAIWPPRPWLPIGVSTPGGRLVVDWAHFGAKPLTEPFFEDSIRRALRRPFNRMFRYRMAVGDFLERTDYAQSLAPSGFIFHMSRCGSTLVSQMLAALPENIAISEAAPIDACVRLNRARPDLADDLHGKFLSAMVAAFGRRRSGSERSYFIKLDSWHTLALPLFRRAFPSVPWIFLYRDPVEVMVSQMRRRGVQTVAEIIPPSFYGIDESEATRSEEYCACVLNKICLAAVDGYGNGDGGGLLVNYRDLPGAMTSAILPHFGVALGERERQAMSLAARFDAKAPDIAFAGDSQAKQREASESIRALAEWRLGAVYRQLERLRLEGLRVESLRAGANPRRRR